MGQRRILVLGAPRSGTTWVAEIFASIGACELIHEPDNEKTSLLARCLKSHLPRFPYLRPGDADPRFALLWRCAFHGRFARWLGQGRAARALCLLSGHPERYVSRKETRVLEGRSVGRGHFCDIVERAARAREEGSGSRLRLVKSVHAVLAAEWVAETSGVHDVVVLLRSPYAVLASLRRIRMPDRIRAACFRTCIREDALERRVSTRPQAGTELGRMTVQLATMMLLLEAAAARHPRWTIVTHEGLCADPHAGFSALSRRLGLDPGDALAQAIDRRDRPGRGYEVTRIAKEEIGKWRSELTRSEAEEITALLDEMGLGHWCESL